MLRRKFLSRLLSLGAATGTVAALPGCGTMLHPERLNQPHSRDIDWKVVALNGLGLFFFFVPGVIAFVVDFHTGAIYLPPVHGAMKPPLEEPAEQRAGHGNAASGVRPPIGSTDESVKLDRIVVPVDQISVSAIERQVTLYCGKPVSLSEPSTRVSEIENLDEFAAAQQRHQEDRSRGLSLRRFLQRFSMAGSIPWAA